MDEAILQAVKLPAVPNTAFILHGRFDGRQSLYAYVLSSGIRFLRPDGTVVAEAVQGTGSARLALKVPGSGGRPDRVLVGWGRDPASRLAQNTVVFTLSDASAKPAVHQVIHQTVSDRADPQDAVLAPDGALVLAWFSDKYTVQVGLLAPGESQVKTVTSAAMISRLGVLGAREGRYTLAVARVYGDEPGSDGGLFLFEDGQWRRLPTVRGVRGLWVSAKPDGWDLWVGDGWNKDYGRVARAYLSVVSVRGQEAQRRQVAEIQGGFSVFDILPCHLFGPKKPGKLLKTNNQLLWIPDAADAPPAYLASWSSPDAPVVADVDGDGYDEILIATPEPMALKAKK